MTNASDAIEHNADKGRIITLEKDKRFSECLLWRMEREYFERRGIDAWLHEVPFYITSNTFIAKSYARIVFHFIRDWMNKHPENRNEPFYIMELGTGPGRFSFYMMKALEELRDGYGMKDLKMVYIMSDFAKANIEYYQSHHALIPYVEKGFLDFAIHDMDKRNTIKLLNSKIELTQKTLVNPLILFANYVFDTIPNDTFCVKDGKIYEMLANLSTPESNLKNNMPVELEKIDIDYNLNEIGKNHYNDPALDEVLELYKNKLTLSSVLIPINSIRGLNHLKKLANGNIMLISSDKAYSDIESLDNHGLPSLSIHGGCFSMMVNCHAIGQYFKNSGGDFFAQSTRRGLKTCFYTSSVRLDDMPETRVAVQDYIEKLSPADFFNMYRNVNETAQQCEVGSLVSYLQFTEWDPHAFSRISRYLMPMLEDADEDVRTFLAHNLPKLADNYYFMPKTDCVIFEVASFFHVLKRYEDALHYYRKADQFMTEKFVLMYNIGLCLAQLNHNEEALEYFKHAATHNPESKEAAEWIEYLEKMITS